VRRPLDCLTPLMSPATCCGREQLTPQETSPSVGQALRPSSVSWADWPLRLGFRLTHGTRGARNCSPPQHVTGRHRVDGRSVPIQARAKEVNVWAVGGFDAEA
jgi:hypothetical protein